MKINQRPPPLTTVQQRLPEFFSLYLSRPAIGWSLPANSLFEWRRPITFLIFIKIFSDLLLKYTLYEEMPEDKHV
jgi:hypothetical protein